MFSFDSYLIVAQLSEIIVRSSLSTIHLIVLNCASIDDNLFVSPLEFHPLLNSLQAFPPPPISHEHDFHAFEKYDEDLLDEPCAPTNVEVKSEASL